MSLTKTKKTLILYLNSTFSIESHSQLCQQIQEKSLNSDNQADFTVCSRFSGHAQSAPSQI